MTLKFWNTWGFLLYLFVTDFQLNCNVDKECGCVIPSLCNLFSCLWCRIWQIFINIACMLEAFCLLGARSYILSINKLITLFKSSLSFLHLKNLFSVLIINRSMWKSPTKIVDLYILRVVVSIFVLHIWRLFCEVQTLLELFNFWLNWTFCHYVVTLYL